MSRRPGRGRIRFVRDRKERRVVFRTVLLPFDGRRTNAGKHSVVVPHYFPVVRLRSTVVQTARPVPGGRRCRRVRSVSSVPSKASSTLHEGTRDDTFDVVRVFFVQRPKFELTRLKHDSRTDVRNEMNSDITRQRMPQLDL